MAKPRKIKKEFFKSLLSYITKKKTPIAAAKINALRPEIAAVSTYTTSNTINLLCEYNLGTCPIAAAITSKDPNTFRVIENTFPVIRALGLSTKIFTKSP